MKDQSNIKDSPYFIGQNEESYRLLVDSVRDYAIFMIDTEGCIVTWNKGAEKIKGYASDEVLGKHISIFYTKNEIEKREPDNNLKKAIEEGRFETEGWRVRKDGSLFWADVVFTALFNEHEELIGFAKVTRDITEQKRIENEITHLNETLEKRVAERTEELQKSEKKFHDLFQNNPMPMWVIDSASLKILDVNEAAIRHYGYSCEEFLSMTALDIRPIEEKGRYLQFGRTSKPANYYAGLWKHSKKDGTVITVEISADDISFEGKPARIILSNDVTEKINAEEKLLLLNEELEDRVKQRTHQLEIANKELEAFSYSVSHDLRAPLRAVNGYAKILEEDYSKVLDEEGRRLLKVVQHNAKKMGALIDDLLAFSRLGRKEVYKFLIKMTELVENVIFELQRDLAHKPEIIVNKLHPVFADYSLMTQVMMNLISNAIKYSSKKEKPVIKISSEKKGNDIVYSVSDNGTGFDMQYAHKLFGVFQRLHGEEFEGTGVGLAIVQRIITRHGGKIWVEAELEKGATFYFSLPNIE